MRKQILVHVHVYYPDIWPILKESLLNISPKKFELYVTTVEENKFLKEEVLTTFPKAHFWIVKNVGYDVGPFMHVIGHVNLNRYNFIVKLHSKRDMPLGSSINNYDVSGPKWRDYAMEFISNKTVFKKVINTLVSRPELGMVSNYRLIMNEEKDDKRAETQAKELLESLNLKTEKYGFVAGSIFVCRAALFEPLKKLNISIKSFSKADKEHRMSTLAHSLERLFGLLILAQGKTIEDVLISKPKNEPVDTFWRKFKRFLYLKRENKQGQIKIKICKIPVFVYKKKKE